MYLVMIGSSVAVVDVDTVEEVKEAMAEEGVREFTLYQEVGTFKQKTEYSQVDLTKIEMENV